MSKVLMIECCDECRGTGYINALGQSVYCPKCAKPEPAALDKEKKP